MLTTTSRCPRCQSSRVQRAYNDTPVLLRALRINYLLCNNCNAEFKGFSLFKTERSRRRNIEVKSRPNVGNLQRAVRRREHLEVTLHLRACEHTLARWKMPATLKGYTRDLSRIGVSLVLPDAVFNDKFLSQEKHRFQIDLELPTTYGKTKVVLHAAAVRFEQLDEDESLTGWLVGARITWIDPQDRARYARFVDAVKQ